MTATTLVAEFTAIMSQFTLTNKGVTVMMYWDNDIDRQIDEELDRMMREGQTLSDSDIDMMYQEHLANKTVCNAVALIGVQ